MRWKDITREFTQHEARIRAERPESIFRYSCDDDNEHMNENTPHGAIEAELEKRRPDDIPETLWVGLYVDEDYENSDPEEATWPVEEVCKFEFNVTEWRETEGE